MGKICEKVGFATLTETSVDVWEEVITERTYYGDLYQCNRYAAQSSEKNANITFSNRLSILADPFAFDNIDKIRYITYRGSKWIVSNIDVQYPRMILSTGGLYNENEGTI